MLGKLCRLEKRCGLNGELTPINVARLPSHGEIRELDELYPKICAVCREDENNQQLARRCRQNATCKSRRRSVRNHYARAVARQFRSAREFATLPFVTVVEIKEDLAHVAAMAGVASGHDVRVRSAWTLQRINRRRVAVMSARSGASSMSVGMRVGECEVTIKPKLAAAAAAGES